MKKLMLILSILFTLSFVACENPFKQLEDTIDAVEAAANLASNVDEITALLTASESRDLTSAELNTIQTALQDVKTVLSNEATAGIIQEYASSQGVTLEQDMINDVKAKIQSGGVAIDLNGDSDTTQENQILTLVNDILNLL